MNDENLDRYKNQAQLNHKAQELVKQDREIGQLESNQKLLDEKKSALESKFQGMSQEEIDKDPQGYHKMRNEYDKAAKESSANRITLEAKQAEHQRLKESYKRDSLGEDTSTAQKTAAQPDSAKTNSAQPKLNERLAPNNDIKDWNKPQQELTRSNAPELDAMSQKAKDKATEAGKQLHDKNIESPDVER